MLFIYSAAEILQNMDKSVDPCQDFYSFACGGFEKKNIPDDRSYVDTFMLISDKVNQQLRFLVEQPIKEKEAEPFKLVKKFYQSCFDKGIKELSRFQHFDLIHYFFFTFKLQISRSRRGWTRHIGTNIK